MGIIIVLLPASLALAALAVAAFVWAARQRQFDRLDVDATRPLFDADLATEPPRRAAAGSGDLG